MSIPICLPFLAAFGLGILLGAANVQAENAAPYPGTQVIATKYGFKDLWDRLEAAAKSNRMGIVGRASASMGAKSQGFNIAGNAIVMVFRNDFARRMLAASVPAGIEAPLRFYVTENAGGSATLTYRIPSSVFAPYENADLDAMAKELDVIFEKIASQAVGS